MKYRPRQKIGERFDVRGYIPPVSLQHIAQERVEGMVGAYLALGARAGDLLPLARSCYMQGLNDAIDALNQSGLKVSKG